MKQKIVIKVTMTCDKCRQKALALVAGTSGVESVKLDGDDKVVVEGEVDSVHLTNALRKKLGSAQLVEVVDAAAAKKKKEEEEKKKKEEEEKNVGDMPKRQYGFDPYVSVMRILIRVRN
ncbi:hypothetical protein QOZ80_2BG0191100 [Eleusine coracana subsp. coracana]|nr:hypothetical protein QOZ80_2BG0191100 [Eleusine coracana subsp. coracana]